VSSRKGKAARGRARYTDRCTRPDKVAYPSREAAKAHLRDMKSCGTRSDLSTLGVYLCDCNFFHIGHASAQLRSGIREAQANDRRTG
jgi:hypothetical protein